LKLIEFGEQTGISAIVNWRGGGNFLLRAFDIIGDDMHMESYSRRFESHDIHNGRPEQLCLALEKRKNGKGAKTSKSKKSLKIRYKRKPTDG